MHIYSSLCMIKLYVISFFIFLSVILICISPYCMTFNYNKCNCLLCYTVTVLYYFVFCVVLYCLFLFFTEHSLFFLNFHRLCLLFKSSIILYCIRRCNIIQALCFSLSSSIMLILQFFPYTYKMCCIYECIDGNKY